MPYIASFDIGTTNVKGILVSSEARSILEKNIPITTMQIDKAIEQNPDQWLEAVKNIIKEWLSIGVCATDISLITFSGQMQDCIPVTLNGNPVRPAILYSDARAGKQADRLREELGDSLIRERTGNHMDGSLTFPKIMWLREHEPQHFEQTASFLISSKDYVIQQLTGRMVTDPTSAATTGLMNLQKRTWETDWLSQYEIAADKLPPICSSDEIVGVVTDQAAQVTGLVPGTPVLCGIGDAGAATIGAGVSLPGEMYAYIGTTGWIATPTKEVNFVGEGVFHLSYPHENLDISIAPLTNAGNAHKWAMSVFGNSFASNDNLAFQELEKLMQSSDRGKNNLLFLPYLNGERCPIQNADATACFIGIKATTKKEDMCCAVLEGVAMGMKQVMELISSPTDDKRITLIGGGSKSAVWNQIIADIFGLDVYVPDESQYLPSMGAAALGFIRLGWDASYPDFSRRLIASQKVECYTPNGELSSHYEQKYRKYTMLYPALEATFKQ
jgi:xylulokinase